MFSSAVLDLVIGLVFCFLTIGLATGAIVEAIASFLMLRATTLRSGIGQLLNDTEFSGLAREIYAHAAVNPRSDGTNRSKKNNPAYIDRQLFGQAMLDVLKISPEISKAANNPSAPRGKPTETALKTAVDGALTAAATAQGKTAPDDQLQKLLYGIIERSVGDPDKIKEELVAWFDNGMDRVSGWYKRWTQAIGFFVSLILAVGLNINTVEVAKALWEQPKLAEDLTKGLAASGLPAGPAVGAVMPLKAQQNGAGDPIASKTTASDTKEKQKTPMEMLQQLDTTMPIGWPHGFWHNDHDELLSSQEIGIAVIGWLITALSALFGAPFWFDLLQSFIRLKGSGPSPQEKVDGKGAAA